MLHIDITCLDEIVGKNFLRCGGCAVPLQILRFANQIKNDFAQRPDVGGRSTLLTRKAKSTPSATRSILRLSRIKSSDTAG